MGVNSKTVEALYREYLSGAYAVNRRYQRKLVWTVEEKARLMDSILKRYPLPQFLVAEDASMNPFQFEIIDGMQRMNAIVAFIENEYSLNGAYFDLESLADTKRLLDDGKIVQREPRLSRDESVRIATYEIAQSVYRTVSSENVEEVFRRINSSGQKLSGQDLRQAGSTSPVADLVREVASRIRGDASDGIIVPLEKMKALSIASNNNPYGISPDEMFWVQQGILNRANVRTSADEQLILDIIADMVLTPMPNTGTPVRNLLFGVGSGEASSLAAKSIEGVLDDPAWLSGRKDEVLAEFMTAFEYVLQIVDALPDGTRLVRHLGLAGNNPIPRYFEAIFIAVWRLSSGENRALSNPALAVQQLRDPAPFRTMPGGGGEWLSHDKERVISQLTDMLRHAFDVPRTLTHAVPPSGVMSHSDFVSIVSRALVESSAYEMKQGLLPLSEPRNFNEKMFEKVIKTLTAISNTHPVTGGRVVVGIADSEETANEIAQLDDQRSVSYRGFHIVGVDRELRVLGVTIDKLWDRVVRRLLESPALDREYAREVASKSRIAEYKGRFMLVIFAPPVSDPVSYSGKYFERIGSSTEEVRDAIAFGRSFAARLPERRAQPSS